jgi:hypothetical protein
MQFVNGLMRGQATQGGSRRTTRSGQQGTYPRSECRKPLKSELCSFKSELFEGGDPAGYTGTGAFGSKSQRTRLGGACDARLGQRQGLRAMSWPSLASSAKPKSACTVTMLVPATEAAWGGSPTFVTSPGTNASSSSAGSTTSSTARRRKRCGTRRCRSAPTSSRDVDRQLNFANRTESCRCARRKLAQLSARSRPATGSIYAW